MCHPMGSLFRSVFPCCVVVLFYGLSEFAEAQEGAALPPLPSTEAIGPLCQPEDPRPECQALKSICAAEDTTAECREKLEQDRLKPLFSEEASVSSICGNSSLSSLPVCVALASGECAGELSFSACAAKLKASEGPSLLERLGETFGADKKLMEGLVAVLIAVLGLVTTFARKRAGELRSRLEGPLAGTFDEEKPHQTRGVNVVLVGESGSGKTALVRALSGSGAANPTFTTAKFHTYSLVHEVDVKIEGKRTHTLTRLYVDDYEGQDAGQLIENQYKVKEREAAIPSTVLVLVVDLFFTPPRKQGAPPLAPRKSWDEARVEQQLEAYSPVTIDMVAKLASKWTHVCLFINKADLIRPMYPSTEEKIQEVYAKLHDLLSVKFIRRPLTVIVGSATEGTGVVGWGDESQASLTLREVIRRAAVPIEGKIKNSK